MPDIILKDESYKIIGICMEVHRLLGMGFKEVVYKDALALEFNSHAISFTREKKFEISYKGIIFGA
jgi:GxxExxY protein